MSTEAQKQHYQKNRVRKIEYQKEWRKKNIERIRLVSQAYHQTERAKALRRARGLPIATRERIRENKNTVFSHYGGMCACCLETNMGFLTIDHINNDGHTFRQGKTRLKSKELYRWIIKNNFPGDLRILCFNCNIGRRNNGGTCPHNG